MFHVSYLVCVSTFPSAITRLSPTFLSRALIRAGGSVNRVVTTHWNKASATIANTNICLVHKRWGGHNRVQYNSASSGVSTMTHSQAESACVCTHVCMDKCQHTISELIFPSRLFTFTLHPLTHTHTHRYVLIYWLCFIFNMQRQLINFEIKYVSSCTIGKKRMKKTFKKISVLAL